MKLHLEWLKPVVLVSTSKTGPQFETDLVRLPPVPGIYVFGRVWGSQFEALYVGKAQNIRSRVKTHFNNLSLMQHVKDSKAGQKVILAGKFISKPGQKIDKSLRILERGLIRHFLSEGHDLVNKQGTTILRHEFISVGTKKLPGVMFVEKSKGE